jgi:hypothetical protein
MGENIRASLTATAKFGYIRQHHRWTTQADNTVRQNR